MKRQDRLDVAETVSFAGTKQNRRHFLRHIIEQNHVRRMIEVGVRDGRTTFYLLDAVPDLTVMAIDIDIRQFYTDDVRTSYGERLIALQGISYRVCDEIPDAWADLIFIDADHSYAAVRQDIKQYQPKLAQNGILCGHDIDYPGVYQAVQELIGDYDVGPNHVWIKKGDHRI